MDAAERRDRGGRPERAPGSLGSVRPDLDAPGPLRVAVLCSARAPGLGEILRRSGEAGAPYRLVACVTSDAGCREEELLSDSGVPLRTVDLRAFYDERGAPISDRSVRAEYDRRVLEAMADARPDALILCGYLYVVTSVLLDAFPGRVVNIHHSDLLRTGSDGRPLYRGLRAVRDAVLAGETETRSTVHLATAEVDEGPILARSEPFPLHPLLVEDARRRGQKDVLKAYAYAHREWMMAESWGPLLDRALERLARRADRTERTVPPPSERTAFEGLAPEAVPPPETVPQPLRRAASGGSA